MKKILFITSRADIGGGPKHLYELARAIGESVEVYIASPIDAPYGERFKVISKKWFKIGHRSFSLVHFFKLLSFCKDHGINIIHSHGRGAGVYSRFLGLWGFEVIHTFHGVHFDQSLVGKVKLYMDRLFNYMTSTFISVSEDEMKIALENKISDESNTIVIANGVDIETIQNVNPLDLKEYVKDGDIVFGTLARLSLQKGIDLLIKSVAQQNTPGNWKFLVGGDGEDEDLFKSMVKDEGLEDKIIFLGSINAPYSFLKSIDCFFSTSRGEGLPLSVLEAMALGLPCVLSDVMGHRTIGKNNEELLLHDFKDFIERCAGYESIDPMKVKDLCIRKYSIDSMVAKTLSVY